MCLGATATSPIKTDAEQVTLRTKRITSQQTLQTQDLVARRQRSTDLSRPQRTSPGRPLGFRPSMHTFLKGPNFTPVPLLTETPLHRMARVRSGIQACRQPTIEILPDGSGAGSRIEGRESKTGPRKKTRRPLSEAGSAINIRRSHNTDRGDINSPID